jgi:hypothetical protein
MHECPLVTADGLIWDCPMCGRHLVTPVVFRPEQMHLVCPRHPRRHRPEAVASSPPAARSPTTTAALLAERYDVGLAAVPRDEADRRLAICRDACDHHFRDSLHFDRCTQSRSCPGNAALVFVKRLTGELEPVKNCLWGTRS